MDTPQPYPAPLGWRLAAALYDLLPLIALWFATAALALAVTAGTLDYHAWWYRLSLLVVTGGYFVLSWRNGGQTIGMRAWRLRVVDANGASPSYAAGALRFAVALVSFAPAIGAMVKVENGTLRIGIVIVSLVAACLGFLWCLYDRDRRAWHDIAAGTRLVRYPKPPKQK